MSYLKVKAIENEQQNGAISAEKPRLYVKPLPEKAFPAHRGKYTNPTKRREEINSGKH